MIRGPCLSKEKALIGHQVQPFGTTVLLDAEIFQMLDVGCLTRVIIELRGDKLGLLKATSCSCTEDCKT